VFLLLGALGVDMTQTLVIGPNQLLVEGPSDVVYLTVMSDVVRQAGGTPLDPCWTITPVGGLDKVPAFVSLLGGSDLSIAVLMDVAADGNRAGRFGTAAPRCPGGEPGRQPRRTPRPPPSPPR
jgi:hypothetical protein